MRFDMLPVADLELDVSNPRVARIVEMYGDEVTYDRMRLALGVSANDDPDTGTTFYSLRESIRTNGGIIHPIIVNETSGRMVVVEGNTRAMIYKEFAVAGWDGDWSVIPSIVHLNLDQAGVDAIRLQSHLVGPRQWDPYSKAKYLEHLRNSQHLTFNQIVDFCGGQQQEVARYIDAYNDIERYYRPILEDDHSFDPTRFSAFVELQRGQVAEAIEQAGFSKSDFARWVDDKRVSPLNLVRSLPRILKNPKAKEIFLTDGAREAVKALDAPLPEESLRNATLAQLLGQVVQRIWEMPYGQLQQLKEHVRSAENDSIIAARDALDQLCRDIASDE